MTPKAGQDDKTENNEEIPTGPLTAQDEALLEFGKELLTKSINVLMDFSKHMITLSIAMISVYFAILKFLGIEESIVEIGTRMSILAISGPLTLIGSTVFFILAILPMKMDISLVDIEDLREARKNMLVSKHRHALIGVVLFVVGLLIMTFTVFLILAPIQAPDC